MNVTNTCNQLDKKGRGTGHLPRPTPMQSMMTYDSDQVMSNLFEGKMQIKDNKNTPSIQKYLSEEWMYLDV